MQRRIYVASLLVAALAIVLLVAPVAYHRWVFRLHDKRRLLAAANRLALAGLSATSVAISLAVLLVVTFVESGWIVPLLVAVPVGAFSVFWFAIPARERFERRQDAANVSRVT
jgi:MFS family permease